MRIREITEARRNPDLNPKHSFTDEMMRRLKESDFIPRTHTQNAFASFTSLEKLGINPSSEFDTPIGIYAYPLKYVYQEIGDKNTTWLPFAGDKPYVNFFSLKDNANILITTKFPVEVLDELYNKLYDIFGEEEVDELVRESPRHAEVNTSFGRFWYVTYMLSKNKGKNPPAYWNGLFRKMGIDAVLDLDEGVIHENEPTQIVIFNPSVINGVERIRNVRTKEVNDFTAQLQKVAHNADPKEIYDLVFDNRYEPVLLEKIPFKLVWKAVKKHPEILKFVQTPIEYQMKIVDEMPQHLEKIKVVDMRAVDYAISKGMAKEMQGMRLLMIIPKIKERVIKALGL